MARVLTQGPPKQLHSDQGKQVELKLLLEVCKLLGIAISRTTPYRPQRFNHTLLATAAKDYPFDWQSHCAWPTTLVFNPLQNTPHSFLCSGGNHKCQLTLPMGHLPYQLFFSLSVCEPTEDSVSTGQPSCPDDYGSQIGLAKTAIRSESTW